MTVPPNTRAAPAPARPPRPVVPSPRRTWSLATERRRDVLALAALVFFPVLFLAPVALTGNLSYGDFMWQQYPFWAFAAAELAELRLPFWNPLIYGGFPQAASSSAAVFYPYVLLFLVLPAVAALHLIAGIPMILSGVFFYAHLRDRDVTCFSAFLAGVMVALSGAMNARLLSQLGTVAGWFPAQIFLADRLLVRRQVRYFWLLAGVCTLQVLAGQPQMVVYSFIGLALYALFAGVSPRALVASLRRVAGVWAAQVLAIGLAAFSLIPTAELVLQSTRSAPSYEFSIQGSYLPLFGLTIAAPWLFGGGPPPFDQTYWGPFEYWWEAVQYVSVVALPLVVLGLWQVRTDRRARTYALLGLSLVVLALGGFTPLHALLFQIPGYGSFRLTARYSLLFAPPLAALAALGLDWARARRLRWPGLLTAAALGFAGLLVVAIGLTALAAPLAITQTAVRAAERGLGVVTPAVIWALVAGSAGLVLLALFLRVARPRMAAVTGAALVLLIVVDLGSFGWFLHRLWAREPAYQAAYVAGCTGSQPRPARPDAVDRAAYFAFTTAPFGGLCSPNYFLLNGRPSANGYDPLVPTRQLELLSPNGYGVSLRPEQVYRHPPLIDLLGIRYILAQGEIPVRQPDPSGRLEKKLQISIGPKESFRYRLDPPVPGVTGLRVVSWLGDAAAVRQGETVATITARDDSGAVVEQRVLAGVHTSDLEWDRPDSPVQRAHARAQVAFDLPGDDVTHRRHAYTGTVTLPAALDVAELTLARGDVKGGWTIDRVELLGLGGEPVHVLGPHDLLLGSGKYREIEHTSDLAVFENATPRPRVWSVAEVLTLPAAEVRRAIAEGVLPDGRPFEPARQALVEESIPGTFAGDPTTPAASGTATVLDARPGRFAFAVAAPADTFFVVNEAYYPGWTLTIDGQPASFTRVNYTQMGFAVPAGAQNVTLWYEPRVFALGLAVSGAALALGLAGTGLLVLFRRRPAG